MKKKGQLHHLGAKKAETTAPHICAAQPGSFVLQGYQLGDNGLKGCAGHVNDRVVQ